VRHSYFGAFALPVFSKYAMAFGNSCTNRSWSPSASMSTNCGRGTSKPPRNGSA
jgi:hypothetical protein